VPSQSPPLPPSSSTFVSNSSSKGDAFDEHGRGSAQHTSHLPLRYPITLLPQYARTLIFSRLTHPFPFLVGQILLVRSSHTQRTTMSLSSPPGGAELFLEPSIGRHPHPSHPACETENNILFPSSVLSGVKWISSMSPRLLFLRGFLNVMWGALADRRPSSFVPRTHPLTPSSPTLACGSPWQRLTSIASRLGYGSRGVQPKQAHRSLVNRVLSLTVLSCRDGMLSIRCRAIVYIFLWICLIQTRRHERSRATNGKGEDQLARSILRTCQRKVRPGS